MLGPAFHAGLEERTVNDQLAAAIEQVEQTHLILGSVKLVPLLNGQPRHPPALGGQRVTGAGQLLLLHEKLLACSLPLLRRDHFGYFHVRCQCLCTHLGLSCFNSPTNELMGSGHRFCLPDTRREIHYANLYYERLLRGIAAPKSLSRRRRLHHVAAGSLSKSPPRLFQRGSCQAGRCAW